jgi:formylglycine-generating enzyme required for sulfatase activity
MPSVTQSVPDGFPTQERGNERSRYSLTQPKFCRVTFRDWHEPTYRSDCVGFRVVQELSK